MPKLSIEDIVFFLTFAESSNSIEAARVLGISQPTLTERLRSLEETLPASPFSRVGRKKVLNPFGKHLYETLGPKVRDLNRVISEVTRAETSSKDVVLRLSGRMEILMSLAEVVQFEGKLVFDPCTSKQAIDRVVRGECDIAISQASLADRDDLVKQLLFKSSGALVVPNALVPRGGLNGNWNFLTGLPCIAYRPTDPFLMAFAKWAGILVAEFNVRIFCENWVMVRELVSHGRGFAAMPLELARQKQPSKNETVIEFPLDSDSRFKFYAFYRKEIAAFAKSAELMRSLKSAFKN